MSPLAGVWQAADVYQQITSQCRGILTTYGTMWTRDMQSMTEMMQTWTPENWQLKRDQLQTDRKLLTAMLNNPNIRKLSDMSVWASGVKENLQWLHRQSPEHFVQAQVLKDCEQAIRAAVDTVATSFFLYNLEHKLPYEPNVNVRAKLLDGLEGAMAAKHVVIGSDSADRVKILRDPKFVPLKKEASPSGLSGTGSTGE